jgi:hypothetical protein
MQRAVQDRVRDFSKSLQMINRDKIQAQPKAPKSQARMTSKREKVIRADGVLASVMYARPDCCMVPQALEFAKRIPKPKLQPEVLNRQGSGSSQHPQQLEPEDDCCPLANNRIRELEAEHDNAKAAAQAIRRSLGTLL